MKRDMVLVRKLLFFFEEKETPEMVQEPPIDGYDTLTVKYHLVLMYDAGLLRCEPVSSSSSDRVIYVMPFELTWDGHEFLDKIRNEKVWKRITDTMSAKGAHWRSASSVDSRLNSRWSTRRVERLTGGRLPLLHRFYPIPTVSVRAVDP